MAYSTGSLDGTTVAAGGVVPFGALKNAPSGTRVNTKMLGDIWQMMMQMAAGAGITLNNLPDNNTNGYQFTEALSKVIGNHAAQIVRMLIGGAYDPTKVYILWGCETRSASGFCMYDGQLYYITGNAGSACGGGLVDVVAVYNPVQYTDGVQALQIICAASGSGVANYADVIFLQDWIDVSGTISTGSGGGGSFVVDPADIQYAKYKITGKTVQFQVSIRNASITSAPAYLEITMPFLPTNVARAMYYLGAVYVSPTGAIPEPCLVLTVVGSPNTIRISAPASGWVVGTDDSGLDVAVTFEIV